MSTPKKKSLFLKIIGIVLVISTILYVLADRYLIEHVEISDVSAYTAAATETAASSSSSSSAKENAIVSPTMSSSDTSTTSVSASTSSGTNEVITLDDWNYQDDNVTISIKEVTTGSGSDKVTYFVADVVVSDATQLLNAFADDSFGTNIIDYTSSIAAANNAIFAINGDYYGFREDGIIIRNGVIYRDVPTRMGLAFYKDGSMKIYDETETTAQGLIDEGVWNTLSFGPALIVDGVTVTDFSNANVDSNLGNHSITGNNPRTGIGLIDNNHFVFVVVDGRSKGYSRGVTLEEFAQIFEDLGCTQAYNIDGGGSSTMYFNGRVVNNPLGKNQERGTSDILYIASAN